MEGNGYTYLSDHNQRHGRELIHLLVRSQPKAWKGTDTLTCQITTKGMEGN